MLTASTSWPPRDLTVRRCRRVASGAQTVRQPDDHIRHPLGPHNEDWLLAALLLRGRSVGVRRSGLQPFEEFSLLGGELLLGEDACITEFAQAA